MFLVSPEQLTHENVTKATIVLQQYCQLKDQMEGKQFYSALKTLEQLEHTSLPQVKGYLVHKLEIGELSYSLPLFARYTFSDLLSREIPKLRRSIQDQSNAELTVSVSYYCGCMTLSAYLQDFLADVREKSIFIGEVAMHQVRGQGVLKLSASL